MQEVSRNVGRLIDLSVQQHQISKHLGTTAQLLTANVIAAWEVASGKPADRPLRAITSNHSTCHARNPRAMLLPAAYVATPGLASQMLHLRSNFIAVCIVGERE